MAVPEVNKGLLGELEEMGFPVAHATRALHSSGNSSLDDAVNWLFEHENDADIDQMPLVPVNIDIESLDSSQVTEGVKLKALELRERASRKKEDEEKKLLRETEKGREGKELLEVKQTREENERIRYIAKRKAEEETLKRDRERIQQKLQQDKVERRRRLGLPIINPPTVKHGTTPSLQMKDPLFNKSANTHLPASTVELIRDCLRSLKINHMDDGFKVTRAFQTLMIYVKNVVKNPHEEKFRKIRLGNPAFQERVGNMDEGIKFLELCGFERENEGKFMILSPDKTDMAALVSAGVVLNSAITNPYFGILSK